MRQRDLVDEVKYSSDLVQHKFQRINRSCAWEEVAALSDSTLAGVHWTTFNMFSASFPRQTVGTAVELKLFLNHSVGFYGLLGW